MIVLSSLGIVAAVLVAFVAVRYDQRFARRQAAADALILWTNRTAALVAEGWHGAVNFYQRGESEEQGKWGEGELWSRIDYAMYSKRLPNDVREAIENDAQDLLTIMFVAMPKFPNMKLAQAEFSTPPPDGLFNELNHEHGLWLDGVAYRIIDTLEAYSSRGKHPTSRAHRWWRGVTR